MNCEMDGILITYTEKDVCFEDCKTAEAILLNNDGSIIHSKYRFTGDSLMPQFIRAAGYKIYPVFFR